MWLTRCDCGASAVVSSRELRSGATKSCGCLCKEARAANGRRNRRHGGSVDYRVTSEYAAWSAAKGRCYNPKTRNYALYGGRGIKMCAAWRDDVAVFLHDMGPKPTPRHSLDRIDGSGDYEPGNCRWATPSEQLTNRRGYGLWAIDGARVSLTAMCEALRLNPVNVQGRLRKGKHLFLATLMP